MMFSAEMMSVDGEVFPNKLRIVKHDDGFVYVEIEATHGGHKVVSLVKVERQVFAYHIKASGVLS